MRWLGVATALVLGGACHAAPYLVKDINTRVTVGSSPESLTAVGSTLFFVASDPTAGRELWKTDGTATGTARVADINPGPGSSRPTALVDVDGTLFFAVLGEVGTERELWKSDGTEEGTVRLFRDTAPAPLFPPFAFGPWVIFLANQGRDLWRSDGTAEGTERLFEGSGSGYQRTLIVGNTLFFAAATDRELWRSDGTPEGTVRVETPVPVGASIGSLFRFADDLGFTAAGDLWTSDGTTQGTMRLTSFQGVSEGIGVLPGGETLSFYVDMASHRELWKSDGTVAGTVRVADIPRPDGDGSERFVRTSTYLFFTVCGHDVDGCVLWRSDGTEEGTVFLTKTYPSYDWDDDEPPVVVRHPLLGASGAADGAVFFHVGDASENVSLWRSDGTVQGTVPLEHGIGREDDEFADDWRARGLVVDGSLYFPLCDHEAGCEPWKSDGTPAGTVRIADIAPGAASSYVSFGTVVDGIVYFVADEPEGGAELWRTDGTGAGTMRVADVYPNDLTASSDPRGLTNVAGTLYFTATEPGVGNEPWRSDGTSAGTIRLADTSPGPRGGGISGFIGAGDNVFFTDFWSGLWRTDGTPGGTRQIADILPWSPSDIGTPFSWDVNGTLFMVGSEIASPTWSCGLWKSDGTEVGTVRVPPFECEHIRRMATAGGVLYLNVRVSDGSFRLWRTDGTSEGATQVTDVPLDSKTPLLGVGGILFFSAIGPGTGLELWKTDGTAAGTSLVVDMNPGEAGSAPDRFAVVNDRLYFTAFNATQVWVSDGTAAGTTRLTTAGEYYGNPIDVGGALWFKSALLSGHGSIWTSDGTPGGTIRVMRLERGEAAYEFSRAGGTVFFVREAGLGPEIWKSDGTPRGTARVEDIGPFPYRPQASSLTGIGDRLFFAAYDGAKGVELHALQVAPSGSRCPDGIRDPGEQCDDGNLAEGDCCSPRCEFEPAGRACAGDPDVCTDEVCDGSGVCRREVNAAACDDGDACTSGDVCTSGACAGVPDPLACLDVLTCHDVSPSGRRRGTVASLGVKSLRQVCSVASLGSAPAPGSTTYLAHHPLVGRRPVAKQVVRVTNRFGEIEVETQAHTHLLVPTVVASGGPAGVPIAPRYRCTLVRVAGSDPERDQLVTARDWLGQVRLELREDPLHLCGPLTGDDGAGVPRFLCYPTRQRARQSSRSGRRLRVENEFGQQMVRAREVRSLCIRSAVVTRGW